MFGKKASMETSLTARCARIKSLVSVQGNGFDRSALSERVRDPPKFGMPVHVHLAVGESGPKLGSGFLSILHHYYPHPVLVVTVTSTRM